MLLACSGVIGLWGIGFFSIDLIRSVFQKAFAAEGMDPAKISGQLTFWAGVTSVMLNRSEEHTSELQSPCNLVCRLLLEKKKAMFSSLSSVIDSCTMPPVTDADVVMHGRFTFCRCAGSGRLLAFASSIPISRDLHSDSPA